jgi:hypothetical protein
MKTIENQGFLPIPNAMGLSVAVKTQAAFQIINKINGFAHVFHGTALAKKLKFSLIKFTFKGGNAQQLRCPSQAVEPPMASVQTFKN